MKRILLYRKLQEEVRVRGHIIGHARNNMQVNLTHAWLQVADYFATHRRVVRLVADALAVAVALAPYSSSVQLCRT